MSIQDKKKKILAYLVKHMNTMDPSGDNAKYYTKLIGSMNDKQFDKFMDNIKTGKFQIHITMPNMKRNIKMENILKAADAVGVELFHRLWIMDQATGKKFLTSCFISHP